MCLIIMFGMWSASFFKSEVFLLGLFPSVTAAYGPAASVWAFMEK